MTKSSYEEALIQDKLLQDLFQWRRSNLKRIFKKNKALIVLFIMIILLIAVMLDIKYEGLFFQLLPASIQSKLADIF